MKIPSTPEIENDSAFAMIGLPIVFIAMFAFCLLYSPIWLLRFYRSRTCHRCNIPFGRVIVRKHFQRPNIKFLLDHYEIDCRCYFCGNQWIDEQIENAKAKLNSEVDKVP